MGGRLSPCMLSMRGPRVVVLGQGRWVCLAVHWLHTLSDSLDPPSLPLSGGPQGQSVDVERGSWSREPSIHKTKKTVRDQLVRYGIGSGRRLSYNTFKEINCITGHPHFKQGEGLGPSNLSEKESPGSGGWKEREGPIERLPGAEPSRKVGGFAPQFFVWF